MVFRLHRRRSPPRCRFAGGGVGTVRRPAGCVTPMTNSSDSRRPSWTDLLREGPAAARLLAAQLHAHPRIRPVGSQSPVIVIPGLLTPDILTRPIRLALG